MPEGVPVSRQFFLVTQKGNFVVDWGNNVYQDVYSGEKVKLEETDFTYTVKDDELMMLKQNKVICDFDQYTVFIYPLRGVFDSSGED